MPNIEPDFDDDFERAVADWRERYRLREDDAVLLLVELFRIHQRHWDDLRRRELPSFELVRADIAKLVETEGDMNYCIFKLASLLIDRMGESYSNYSMCGSAMEHAKKRFMRFAPPRVL